MQLTPAQRRFYIDPVQDSTLTTDTILVTEERSPRSFGSHLDKVVTVKANRYPANGRQWWITDTGDYVSGAPVNPANLSYVQIIGVGGDDWFWYGTASRRGENGYVCTGLRRSDAHRLPGNHGAVTEMQVQVPTVVKAAPWAGELFPAYGDSDDVVRAKLALAEQRWNHRRAKAEIIRQGIDRGWHDDLAELRESGKLPAATFKARYKGKVMIEAANPPAADTLSVRDNERLISVRTNARITTDPAPRVATMYGVDVDIPLGAEFHEYDEVRKMPMLTLIEQVRHAIGDYTAMPGLHTITPVLRSIA